MFLAGDALNRREQKIRDFVDKEPAIAVLLAAANFEWTLCRALLFLSKTPNQELRHKIAGVRGFDSYKKLWHKELVGLYNGEGFEMRNKLIHGQDRVTRNMAIP